VQGYWLTRDFYKGDRAMRESGFDTTFNFGPFSGSTHHYASVALNSLLYRYEQDLAWMAQRLQRNDEARAWSNMAKARRVAMDRYLWNPQQQMYFDYDFSTHRQSSYSYLTTFYPLWVGAADRNQASGVIAALHLFEHPGGLAMSAVNSGVQWDLPYGWAPTLWIAVEGMLAAGDHEDAHRVAANFEETVRANYNRDHTIHEKYDVTTGSSEFQVTAGYRQNVVGFGWTNAVYLDLKRLARWANPKAG
jgi:alpha,alpha-trehalase